jgi:hypothetical protein
MSSLIDLKNNCKYLDISVATVSAPVVNATTLNTSSVNISVLSFGDDSVGKGTVGDIACSKVTSNSIILCTYAVAGDRTLPLDVITITPSVGFTVTGDAGATFFYIVIN